MKTSLETLRQKLESAGVKTTIVQYRAFGKVVKVGFDAVNENLPDQPRIKIEPQFRNVWMVSFDYKNVLSMKPYKGAQHYAKRRGGFQPSLCRLYKFMHQEIFQHLEIWERNSNSQSKETDS